MKKTLKQLAIVACVATATVTAQAGGVPTFDATNVAQSVKQIQNQIKQIENLRDQLKSATGNARLGVLLNDPTVSRALAKYTPKGVNLKDLADGNYDRTLQSIAKRIEDDIKKGNQNQDPKTVLAQAQIMNMASIEQSMNTLNALANQTQRIANQINSTTDVASKADLANTLQANSSQIQIAIAQFDLKLKQMEMLEKQAEKAVVNDFDKKQNR